MAGVRQSQGVVASGRFRAGFLRAAAAILSCAAIYPFAAGGAEPRSDLPKVAVIYTIATPALKEGVEKAVREEFGGRVEILRYEDAAVFEETAKAGRVGREAAARFLEMYSDAARSGALAVLSVCSTVSDLACSMRETGELAGVPIVNINDEMCREAARLGKRILVVSTLPSAADPVGRSVLRAAAQLGREVEVSKEVVGGGLDTGAEALKVMISEKLRARADSADVIVFAQASMEPCAGYVGAVCGKRVMTSPKFGAKALKSALAGGKE